MPAMEIKASDVQKLRQTTGAGLMDCKKALGDAGGDFEKAIRILREQGIAKSSKRSDRTAGEGLVDIWVSDSGKEAVMLELNCETDFVARNDEFKGLAKKLIEDIRKNPKWSQASDVPIDAIKEVSGKIGEKVELSRFVRLAIPGTGVFIPYIHLGSKLGVLIQLETANDGAISPTIKELGKELALQVAGANPSYISRDQVPADILQKEKEIVLKQMEGQKKPPEILDKIATGKLKQFFEQHCLLDQPHVRDASGKTPVKKLLEEAGKKEGCEINVSRFERFRVGETA
jgi:elongation factor Ts